MAYDEVLAGRIRDRLQDAAGVTEKKMFGGLAFLTHGHLTVGVNGDDLIARIGPGGMTSALAEPGVRPFDMTGRASRGMIVVAGGSLDDLVLEHWIEQACGHVAALPPK